MRSEHMKILQVTLLLLGLLTPTVLAEGDPTAGVQVYKSNCAQCHGPNMEGGIGLPLKGSTFVADSDEAALKQMVAEGREDKGMPAFKDQLSEQEILDVAALLKNPEALAAAQDVLGTDILEPEVNTDDIFPELKKTFLFVFAWTAVAMVALLAWIKNRG